MLCEQLKKIRENHGLKQNELAKILNISSATYNTYERNISFPPIETLIKIANYFNVSLDELVGRNYSKPYTTLEQDILRTVNQLSNLEQSKVLGYAKARVEAQSEIKDIKNKTGYRGWNEYRSKN